MSDNRGEVLQFNHYVQCHDCGLTHGIDELTSWSARDAGVQAKPLRICRGCLNLSRHLRRVEMDARLREAELEDEMEELSARVWVSLLHGSDIGQPPGRVISVFGMSIDQFLAD